jgi:acylphosphatase
VQGVSYRASAADEADALGLVGWVKNLPNGDVEAVAQGPAQAIEKFVTWCKLGPSEARVESVQAEDEPVAQDLSAFRILRS